MSDTTDSMSAITRSKRWAHVSLMCVGVSLMCGCVVMKDKMYDMYTRFQMRNDSAFSSDPKR